MRDPHETLGVGLDADAAAIRARYLELARQFPPDRAPERFAEIRAAYDALNTPDAGLDARLFQTETTDSIDALRHAIIESLCAAPLNADALLALADAP